MSKILLIDENPKWREIHTSAYMLSMLNVFENFSPKWVLQNCIKTIYTAEYNGVLTYKHSPVWFLKYFNSHPSIYYPQKDIINNIKQEINAGFYVILCVNEFYIPERKAFQKFYYEHDIIIYGYDDKNFYTLAYNKDGLYKTLKIEHQIVEKAFLTHREHYFKFYSMKPKDNYLFDFINIKKIKEDLLKFLYPDKENEGIRAYECLYSIAKSLMEYDKNLDLRSFRFIMERSSSLCLFKDIFSLPPSVSLKLENQKNLSTIIFTLAQKYNIAHSKRDSEKILKNLLVFIENEKELYVEILKEIKDDSVSQDTKKHRFQIFGCIRVKYVVSWFLFILMFAFSEAFRICKKRLKNTNAH